MRSILVDDFDVTLTELFAHYITRGEAFAGHVE